MTQYIYQHKNWPDFHWSKDSIMDGLAATRHKQGRLLGKMENIGFELQTEAQLEILTQDIIMTSEIEGEHLDLQQVRSSVARKLGLELGGLVNSDRHIDGLVEVMMDAINHNKALSVDRLFGWHNAMFPTGYGGMYKIKVGCWRDDSTGPMQVVSGPMGRERVHFQAPPASKVAIQMDEYISWFNEQAQFDQIIKAAIGHLWFITIHPFEDGNGRIARVLTDMLLSQSDGLGIRFYSMSVQIRKERSEYYNILERTQKGDLDLTHWIDWFINCLSRALDSSLDILEQVLFKHRYWTKYRGVRINDRQEKLIIRLMEGFKGKLTTSKWAKIAKCSQDTALRDIQDLMNKNMMIQNIGKGKNTSYDLNKQV